MHTDRRPTVLAGALSGDRERMTRFEREAQLLAPLNQGRIG